MSAPAAPAPAVPRIGRLLDVVGLALLLAGALAYGRAWLGMRELQGLVGASRTAGAAMAAFDHFWRLSRLGIALFAAGVAVAIAAAAVAKAAARRA